MRDPYSVYRDWLLKFFNAWDFNVNVPLLVKLWSKQKQLRKKNTTKLLIMKFDRRDSIIVISFILLFRSKRRPREPLHRTLLPTSAHRCRYPLSYSSLFHFLNIFSWQKMLLTIIVFGLVAQHFLGCEADSPYTPKGKGGDVVADVVEMINSLGIFPNDHKFLCRVAWVESKYGVAPGTYRPFYYGGIWQVKILVREKIPTVIWDSVG